MRADFEKVLTSGPLIKRNVFHTDRGAYRIDIRELNKRVYFFKYRDDVLLECMDLNSKVKIPVPTNDNTCVCCGDIIPEGLQVCPTCMKKAVGFYD